MKLFSLIGWFIRRFQTRGERRAIYHEMKLKDVMTYNELLVFKQRLKDLE